MRDSICREPILYAIVRTSLLGHKAKRVVEIVRQNDVTSSGHTVVASRHLFRATKSNVTFTRQTTYPSDRPIKRVIVGHRHVILTGGGSVTRLALIDFYP
jgi:hypothetical protein